MGALALFKRKETDLLNYAHTVANEATAIFDDVVADLHHAVDVYEHVKETAKAEIQVLTEDFNAAVAKHNSRHDAAVHAQSRAQAFAAKVEALFK